MKITGQAPEKVRVVSIQDSQTSQHFHLDEGEPAGLQITVHPGALARRPESTFPPHPLIVVDKRKETMDMPSGGKPSSAVAHASAKPHRNSSTSVGKQKKVVSKKRKATMLSHSIMRSNDDDDANDFIELPVIRPLKKCAKNVQRAVSSKAQKAARILPPTVRCAPGHVVHAIGLLTEAQKLEVRKLGFGSILDLKLEGLETRELLCYLMDKIDPSTLVINVGTQDGLKITPHAVSCVLGVPTGGIDPPIFSSTDKTTEYNKLRVELGVDRKSYILEKDCVERIKLEGTDPLTIRCFLLIVFSKLLFPGTANHISMKEVVMTSNLEDLPNIDWSKVVVDDIRQAVLSWRRSKDTTDTRSISGCAIFLIVYYLDNLLCKDRLPAIDTPRAAYFSKNVVQSLLAADRWNSMHDGQKFGKLALRSKKGTCYWVSDTHPPELHNEAPNISSHVLMPSFCEQLADCLVGLSQPKKRSITAALSKYDEKMEKVMREIRSTQLSVVQEIRDIMHPHRHSRTSPRHDLPMVQSNYRYPDRSSNQPLHVDHVSSQLVPLAPDCPQARDAYSLTQAFQEDVINRLSTCQQDQIAEMCFGPVCEEGSEQLQAVPPQPCCLHSESSLPSAPSFNVYIEKDGPSRPNVQQSTHDHQETVNSNNSGIFTISELLQGVGGEESDSPSIETEARLIDEMWREDQRREEEGRELFSKEQAAMQTIQQTCAEIASATTIEAQGAEEIVDDRLKGVPQEDILDKHDLPQTVNTVFSDAVLQSESQCHEHFLGECDQMENCVVRSSSQVLNLLKPANDSNVAAEDAMPSGDVTVKGHSDVASQNVMPVKIRKGGRGRKHTIMSSSLPTKQPGKTFSATYTRQASRSKTANTEHPIIFRGDPPQTVFRKRISRVPLKFVSPFKNRVKRVIPEDSASKVRNIILNDESLQNVELISCYEALCFSDGKEIADSFSDGCYTMNTFLSYFMVCMRHDEKILSPESGPFRVFLKWQLSSMLNAEEQPGKNEYDPKEAVKILSDHLNGIDPAEIKLILYVFHHRDHFSVYCINLVHSRIDVLDSLDYDAIGTAPEAHHLPMARTVIQRLNDAFKEATGGKFAVFSRWPMCLIPVQKQSVGPDCAFFVMKFLEYYDGEETKMHCTIRSEEVSQYRADSLFYLLFHDLNAVNPLPEMLERFRPVKQVEAGMQKKRN